VNGSRVNVPSYHLRPGDVVGLHPSKREGSLIKDSIQRVAVTSPPVWLSLDTTNFEGRVLRAPARSEISADVNEQLIVEFYTR
jgi:small subunit ribosomal protein S4